MKMMNIKDSVYAFIDSQNLNLGVKSQGWMLDFGRFRKFLRDKYHVEKAFLFIGFVSENQTLYTFLQKSGYICVFKPTLEINKQGKRVTKGNVDAELVLHAAKIQYDKYDEAVIVSGDGDFYCLHEFLLKNKKLLRIIIPNEKSESSLLKTFQEFKTFIFFERSKLEFKPK